MTLTERIAEHVRRLPEPAQEEVLDFVEYLEGKAESEDHATWNAFSLSQALRDMASEAFSYSEADLKETFS